MMSTSGGVFNSAAQTWNHDFYWQSLSPNGGGEPVGELANAINAKFGNFEVRSYPNPNPNPPSLLIMFWVEVIRYFNNSNIHCCI